MFDNGGRIFMRAELVLKLIPFSTITLYPFAKAGKSLVGNVLI
jgi:hypothetical protein